MKLFLMFPIVAALVLAAADRKTADPKTTKNAKPATPPAAPTPKAVEVPAGAVETAPYTYRFVDPQGKAWIYHKTPFGVSRSEEKPAVAAVPDNAGMEFIKATEDGETIRFERATPFGASKWVKKKSELSDLEKAVWERELSRRNPEPAQPPQGQ